MAKTMAQIQKQIAKLQQEAEALKVKEGAGVVQRIKEAIAHYGLTAQDLFGAKAGKAAPPKKAKAARKNAAAKKVGKKTKAGVIRYRDDAGHTWTGNGKRPNWFKDAIASGKTPEDLLVKA